MYCNKCGAAVVGKYCSCCGTRVRSQLEDFRLAERRAEKEFIRAHTYDDSGRLLGLDKQHLAIACWCAAQFKYGVYRHAIVDGKVPNAAFGELETIRIHAEKLFDQLVDF